MKIKFLTLVFALFVFAGSAFSQTTPAPTPAPSPTPAPKAEPANINGKWTLNADAPGQTIQIAVEFKQTGETFTGGTFSQMGNGTIDGGKVSGNSITGVLHADIQGNIIDFAIEGTINGDKMTGTFVNAQFGTIPFTATRDK